MTGAPRAAQLGHGLRWLIALLLVASVTAAIVEAVRGGGRSSSGSASRVPAYRPEPARGGPQLTAFGVLLPDAHHLQQDRAAGVRLVTLGVSWAQWEPTQGTFSSAYRAYVRSVADAYRAVGISVAVDPGLQDPPRWAFALQDGTLLDQHHLGAATVDFAWSSAVRRAATVYLDQMVAAMGPVVDYRIGLSEHGEALYPDTSGNQWWAFTAAAQHGGRDLPTGLQPTPLPGWVPGTATWRGTPVSVAQATTWYNWYFSGSVNSLAWEMQTIRATGYPGQLELVMPGTGALPATYGARLAALLATSSGGTQLDGYFTMNTAAVWWKLLDALPDLTHVAVDISSVDDDSGSPRANGCTPRDTAVRLHAAAIEQWSDTRWLAYLADTHHLPVLGENPGHTPPSELPSLMNLVTSCRLTALQWAWDANLYAHDGSADLQQLSAALRGAWAAERSSARG